MRTVKHILESKPRTFNTIQPNELVINALNLLNALNLSYLVVMEGDEYKGIFSERDYSRNVILKGLTSSSATVKEVMTTDVPIVSIADTAENCMNLLNLFKTRYLLVYDANEKFAGVVTINDILRQVISSKEEVFDTCQTGNLISDTAISSIY